MIPILKLNGSALMKASTGFDEIICISPTGGRRDRRLPLDVVISVGCFSHSPSWNARWHFARAVGLGSRAPCPSYGRSCRESPRQRDGTLLRTRDVPPPDCARLSCCFSHIGRKISAACKNGLNSGQIESHSCFCRVNRPYIAATANKARTHTCALASAP